MCFISQTFRNLTGRYPDLQVGHVCTPIYMYIHAGPYMVTVCVKINREKSEFCILQLTVVLLTCDCSSQKQQGGPTQREFIDQSEVIVESHDTLLNQEYFSSLEDPRPSPQEILAQESPTQIIRYLNLELFSF